MKTPWKLYGKLLISANLVVGLWNRDHWMLLSVLVLGAVFFIADRIVDEMDIISLESDGG